MTTIRVPVKISTLSFPVYRIEKVLKWRYTTFGTQLRDKIKNTSVFLMVYILMNYLLYKIFKRKNCFDPLLGLKKTSINDQFKFSFFIKNEYVLFD